MTTLDGAMQLLDDRGITRCHVQFLVAATQTNSREAFNVLQPDGPAPCQDNVLGQRRTELSGFDTSVLACEGNVLALAAGDHGVRLQALVRQVQYGKRVFRVHLSSCRDCLDRDVDVSFLHRKNRAGPCHCAVEDRRAGDHEVLQGNDDGDEERRGLPGRWLRYLQLRGDCSDRACDKRCRSQLGRDRHTTDLLEEVQGSEELQRERHAARNVVGWFLEVHNDQRQMRGPRATSDGDNPSAGADVAARLDPRARRNACCGSRRTEAYVAAGSAASMMMPATASAHLRCSAVSASARAVAPSAAAMARCLAVHQAVCSIHADATSPARAGWGRAGASCASRAKCSKTAGPVVAAVRQRIAAVRPSRRADRHGTGFVVHAEVSGDVLVEEGGSAREATSSTALLTSSKDASMSRSESSPLAMLRAMARQAAATDSP